MIRSKAAKSMYLSNHLSDLCSRRRWLASVGASFACATLGCEAKERSRPAAVGNAPIPEAVPEAVPQVDADGRWVAEPILDRAVHWLWDRQSRGDQVVLSSSLETAPPPERDGSWKSRNYAQLKSGRTLTPLVLHALKRVSYEALPCGLFWSMAYDYLVRSVDEAGVVGNTDRVEYPNYATALAVQALLAEPPADIDRPRLERMVAYLVGQQYCEASGFEPSHVAYGGWGFGGARPVGGSPGHMDLGHTRHVLEALRAAGHADPATYRRAERFLRLMQKHPTEDRSQPGATLSEKIQSDKPASTEPAYDGGFYFSPVVLAANKAGTAEHEGRSHYRSYATATCDGILSLLACGVPRDDERIKAASDWLRRHPALDYPGGIPSDTNENWRASIRFYHFAVRAECYAALEWPDPWRDELRTILTPLQQPDGSFVNLEGALMKEDDPILATTLAVIALSK